MSMEDLVSMTNPKAILGAMDGVADDFLPFDTTRQALTFAFNFSASTLDRPPVSRMADKYKPTGRGWPARTAPDRQG